MNVYGSDADKYVTHGADPNSLTWQQAVNQTGADKYNRILDLLGTGGQRLSGSSFDPRFGFNEGAYVNDIVKAAGQKKADTDYQAKVSAEQARQAQDARDKQADSLQSQLNQLQQYEEAARTGAATQDPARQGQIADLMNQISQLRGGGASFSEGSGQKLGIDPNKQVRAGSLGI